MAILLLKPPSVRTSISTMVKAGFMQLFMVVMAIAERCTRAVPVQEYPAKKVHVLRRVPAACSNWDKAWSWLTKVDCGTKYRLDYVTVPNREVRQYKLQYVCCDGDTDCKEADNIQTSGFDTTDEKFLAIVLGSTAACVVIIIIVLAITFYTKKKRCHIICDQESHVYASADGDESQDGNGDNVKFQPEDFESETDQKGVEVEYAEINDPRLPRYTDIFKDNMEVRENPFNNASAPPMYSVTATKSYANACLKKQPSLSASDGDEIQAIAAVSSAPNVAESEVCERAAYHPGQDDDPDDNDDVDTLYYNVREKRKKTKRSSSQSGSASSSKVDVRSEREGSNSAANSRASIKKGRTASVTVEMVKSSSASETIGKNSDGVVTKHKRRSAPPESMGVPSNFIHRHPSAAANVPRSPSNSSCSVIDESAIEPYNYSDKCPKATSSKSNSQQKLSSKSSRKNSSESSYSGASTRPRVKESAAVNSAVMADSPLGSLSPTKEVLIPCRNSTSMELECESTQPGEKDSLLRTPSCHSGCGSDRTSEECEHCCKYDRLNYVSDAADVESIHIYQCLDDVRREVQELWPASSSTCSGVSLPKKADRRHSSSTSRQSDSFEIRDNSIGKNSQTRI